MTNTDHSFELATMAANEKMGAALSFIYTQHPEIKDEVLAYLADYPFLFSQHFQEER